MAIAVGKRRFDFRKTLWWATFALCSAVFALHFTFVEIMNLPTNPIKLQYYDILEAYVNPFFTQNWSFFAPDPIANDLSLFVRAERRGADGKMLQSPWYDVTEALIDASNGKPLSPIGSDNLALSSAIVQFVNAINKTPSATVVRRGEKFVKPHITTSIDPADAMLMTRIGTAALLRHYGGMHVDRVQIGLRFYKFPRFTERSKPDRPQDGHLVMLEWQPAPAVAPL
jgi:hypothetical protein